MVGLTFSWHTVHDSRTCAKCMSLSEYKWYFYNEMPKALLHPHYGLVWDLIADQSCAHGYPSQRGGWHCRCYVDWEIDDSDLQDDLVKLREDSAKLENQMIKTELLMENFHALLAGLLK